MTRSRVAVLVFIAVALGYQPAGGLAQTVTGAGVKNHAVQQTPVPPAYRAGVVLVPVDVRVVDADGKPVTDLTAGDFTVFENGVRQQIAHFSTQAYFEGAPPAPTPRTFFFVLGRGRLNEPAKALDAVIEFLRSRLLPENRVGLLAYLHLVEPTTDHAAVVRLLERYRTLHGGIEDKLARDANRGPGAPSWALAPDTQLALQALFDAPGLPTVLRFPGGAGGLEGLFNDSTSTWRTLEYLGQVAGEKHLVLLTEYGLPNGDYFARRAAAARVSLSVIQTGGVRGPRALTTGRLAGTFDPAPSPNDVLAAMQDRTLAEETGGVASFNQQPDKALDRLASVTSFQYLVGYYPIKPPADGEYRDLRVTVNRRGLTLLYRHAYEARPRVDEPIDVRAMFVKSYMLHLATMPPALAPGIVAHSNIPMKLSRPVVRSEGDARQVTTDVRVDATYVTFTREGDTYSISLDLAAFVRDGHEKVLGEQWARVDLKVDASGYARLKRDGIRHSFTVNVTGRPSQIVVVVYEYEASRGAWATANVR
jgi:VWFA-related protein